MAICITCAYCIPTVASPGGDGVFSPPPGAPQPSYRWLKDGQYLGDFTTEHFYRIHNTQRSDAGEYQCIAKNSVGAIFSEKAQVAVACEYYWRRGRGEEGEEGGEELGVVELFGKGCVCGQGTCSCFAKGHVCVVMGVVCTGNGQR